MRFVPDVPTPFDGGGTVGADLAGLDWARHPLGPPESWPQSLTSAVSIVLTSRFSMWMMWGPELTFFCNDAYRRDTLGKKYPWALGRRADEVWAEIWPDIAPRIEAVMTTGVATWDEGLLLFLERSGYTEESYHTFSYSPLTGDDGTIVGMLCVVIEETERVITARRIATLGTLGAALAAARTEPEVVGAFSTALATDGHNLPFALLYGLTESGDAILLGSTGDPTLELADPQGWPVPDAATSQVVDGLPGRYADLPTGAWDDPPLQALVVPMRAAFDAPAFGFIVAGLNRHRPLDDDYESFVSLIAGQVAAGLVSARAFDAQRQRAEDLAELDRAKTAFFTNVSHELRTPLTLLLGPAEDALNDTAEPLPPRQRARVDVVNRNAQRLLRLVNTLLDFSRLEAGSTMGSFEPVDLGTYTAELASTFSVATERVGLSLTIDCPPSAEPVWVDREMWANVVLNLLSNALKFTFSGGITVSLHGGSLTVNDTGAGIPEHEVDRLFERFHRVAGAQSRTHEGSGIGLALVAELVELHGGSVSATSALGVGSSFVVELPLGSDHLPADQLVVGTPAPVDVSRAAEGFLAETGRWLDETRDDEPVAVSGERPRVLVIDDNADMRDYVRSLLAELYEVITAVDGQDGLDKARREQPDLVLTDVMLPVLDGFELMARLRADSSTSHLPIVMLSARAGEEATVEGLEAGADDYLVKPFAARELLARVRANLELDRVRRTRAEVERSRALLDQAQRLAQVSSWEVEIGTERLAGSDEFLRQLGMTQAEMERLSLEGVLQAVVHPEDLDLVHEQLARAALGERVEYDVRLSGDRVFHAIGQGILDAEGNTTWLRGSFQDVTAQRLTELALADAAAAREAADREHQIADELQASLLPAPSFAPDHLQVATYYQAGVQGTQVGGDWYDVIELGAGRTALVLGDVMGRGVRAAAVMGQLRSAVRAYAQLDLPPADVLENLDLAVRELGSDQIVTCVYAVYDPSDRSLTYANAGHLPPLLCEPGQPVRQLTGSASPPLGIGLPSMAEETVRVPAAALIALYTDGLVEHRDRDIDTGVDALAAALEVRTGDLATLPDRLVAALLPDGPDDDIALLLAEVDEVDVDESAFSLAVGQDLSTLRQVRHDVADVLRAWGASLELVDDIVLIVSELVTNALVHGRPPVALRLRRSRLHVVLEVEDHATYLPRRMRPGKDDEHGRGLQLTALLARRWGTRPTRRGKVVWCVFPPVL